MLYSTLHEPEHQELNFHFFRWILHGFISWIICNIRPNYGHLILKPEFCIFIMWSDGGVWLIGVLSKHLLKSEMSPISPCKYKMATETNEHDSSSWLQQQIVTHWRRSVKAHGPFQGSADNGGVSQTQDLGFCHPVKTYPTFQDTFYHCPQLSHDSTSWLSSKLYNSADILQSLFSPTASFIKAVSEWITHLTVQRSIR